MGTHRSDFSAKTKLFRCFCGTVCASAAGSASAGHCAAMAGGECGLLRRRWRGRRCRRPGLPVTVYLALLYTLCIGVAVCGGRTIDLSEYGAHVYHPMPGAVIHGGAPLCIAMNVTHTPSQPDPATGARHTSTMLPAALDPVLAACLYVSGAEACSNVTTIAFAVAPEVTYSIQGRVRAAQDASLAGPLSPAFHIRTGAVDPPCVPRDRPRKVSEPRVCLPSASVCYRPGDVVSVLAAPALCQSRLRGSRARGHVLCYAAAVLVHPLQHGAGHAAVASGARLRLRGPHHCGGGAANVCWRAQATALARQPACECCVEVRQPGPRHPVHGTRATAVILTCERAAL